MEREAHADQIEDTVKSHLQDAYAEALNQHGIESGDITPMRLMEMEEAEDELVQQVYDWIKSRVEQRVMPISDADHLGKEVFIMPGEYERTNYLDAGGSHSEEHFEIKQPTKGMVVEEVYEGKRFYNVAVRDSNYQRLFLFVEKENIQEEIEKSEDSEVWNAEEE